VTEGQAESPDETGHHPAEEQTCTEAGGHVERVVCAHVPIDTTARVLPGWSPWRAAASVSRLHRSASSQPAVLDDGTVCCAVRLRRQFSGILAGSTGNQEENIPNLTAT
jgi:hypothetical protein